MDHRSRTQRNRLQGKTPEVCECQGRFKEFDARIYAGGDDFSSAEITVQINSASIDIRY